MQAAQKGLAKDFNLAITATSIPTGDIIAVWNQKWQEAGVRRDITHINDYTRLPMRNCEK